MNLTVNTTIVFFAIIALVHGSQSLRFRRNEVGKDVHQNRLLGRACVDFSGACETDDDCCPTTFESPSSSDIDQGGNSAIELVCRNHPTDSTIQGKKCYKAYWYHTGGN